MPLMAPSPPHDRDHDPRPKATPENFTNMASNMVRRATAEPGLRSMAPDEDHQGRADCHKRDDADLKREIVEISGNRSVVAITRSVTTVVATAGPNRDEGLFSACNKSALFTFITFAMCTTRPRRTMARSDIASNSSSWEVMRSCPARVSLLISRNTAVDRQSQPGRARRE